MDLGQSIAVLLQHGAQGGDLSPAARMAIMKAPCLF